MKSAEEYFPEEILKNAVRVDSHFRGLFDSFFLILKNGNEESSLFLTKKKKKKKSQKGWINPELIEKYGLESNAQDAWEKNGGGTFSFRNPLGVISDSNENCEPAQRGRKKKKITHGPTGTKLIL